MTPPIPFRLRPRTVRPLHPELVRDEPQHVMPLRPTTAEILEREQAWREFTWLVCCVAAAALVAAILLWT